MGHNLNVKNIIKDHRTFIIFALFYFLIHLLFLNINAAEWGDTYRMIRASNFLSRLEWSWDEKRWPFYPLLLVPGIFINNPILWGRLLSVMASFGVLLILYLFYLKFVSTNKYYALISVIITSVSSIFAYWSFRVMADPIFAFLIICFYYFFTIEYSKDKKVQKLLNKLLLSVALICITMTRLEGLFALSSVLFYLSLISFLEIKRSKNFRFLNFIKTNNFRDLCVYLVPQFLIYIPWTLYAKVLYKGPVLDDYLKEATTFVFDIDRFGYFITYTLFPLVIPILSIFILFGFFKIYKNLKFLPIGLFILQEFIIGFIWTPSLPRLYTPIIAFLVLLAVFGIESYYKEYKSQNLLANINLNKFNWIKNNNVLFTITSLFLTVLFAGAQFYYKHYFLGASKVLFIIVVLSSIVMSFSFLFDSKLNKGLFIIYLISLSILISAVVINNHSDVYRTINNASVYALKNFDGASVVAYSDETAIIEWNFRYRNFYLSKDAVLEEDSQYDLLKDNKVNYLIWTDEYNRGSAFIDPQNDSRYSLVIEYEQPIEDLFAPITKALGVLNDADVTVFNTRIYKVN